jgi:DNA-binding response OmpR family regulator
LSSVSPNAHAHLLIVEDDGVIHRMLTETLSENGFVVTGAVSAAEMDWALAREAIDLVVLDVMLPGEDGFSICSRLRASSNLPILMLTALGQEIDRVVGLEIGATITSPSPSIRVSLSRASVRCCAARALPARARSSICFWPFASMLARCFRGNSS